MYKVALSLTCAVCVLFASFCPTRAEQIPLPILRSTIVVSGDTISLADLLEGKSLPNKGVYSAPAPGQTGMIKSSRILEAAQKAGIPAILGDLSGSVTVTRKARLVSIEEIETVLKQSIREKTGIEQVLLTFSKSNSTSDVFVEDDARALPVITNLKIDPSNFHFTADLTVPGSRALSSAPRQLDGQITDLVDIAVLTRTLAKADIITTNDIKIEKRERTALAGINRIKPELAIGQAVREQLSSGTILTADLVSKPILVEKAMAVSVTYSVGGLKLTLRGKANDAGALGDMIAVLNPQSKKTIFATVIGPGSVAVLTPPNADIALRQTTSTVQ